MRMRIDIDDALLTEAQKLSGHTTKKAAVEEGLRLLIRLSRQAEVAKAFGKYPSTGLRAERRETTRTGTTVPLTPAAG